MANLREPSRPEDLLSKARRRYGLDVTAGDGSETDLHELLRLIYPRLDIHEARYLDWEYRQNPAGKAILRLGRIKGSLAGQYAVIPLRFRVHGQDLLGSLSLNTVTHPEHRGKGVFMVLAEDVFQECRAAGIFLTLGFPNPYSHKGFLRHLGFQEMGRIPLWINPLRPGDLLKFKVPGLSRWLRPLFPLLDSARGVFSRRLDASKLCQGFFLQEAVSVGPAFDHFWSRASQGYKNLVVRDAAYLRWRFEKHPTRSYKITAAKQADKVLGYIVTRSAEISGVSCGLIIDMLVEPGEEGGRVARALTAHATQAFQQQGLALAGGLMLPGTSGAKALQRSGYFVCPSALLPQPFPVILRWHGDRPPEGIEGLENWYITMGDYDAV